MQEVTDPKILAQLNAGMSEVTDPTILAQLNASAPPAAKLAGPQPSAIDRAVGFPATRLAHDFIGKPLESLVTLLSDPNGSAPMGYDGPKGDVAGLVEKPYQASLARNRNTPGYAAARAMADKVQAANSHGGTDQMLAPVLPALAGAMGVGGGFDAMNANADAQAASQGAYASANPKTAFGSQMLGGLLMSPQGSAARVPAYAGDNAMMTQMAHGPNSALSQAPSAVSVAKPYAEEATKAGYSLTPRMVSKQPGMLADGMSAWSGKVKTAQAASAKNQEVTNSLAATDLGLPADTVFTDKVFKDVRSEAGKAYGAIPKAIPVVKADKEFLDGVSTLGGANTAAANEFPDIMGNPDVEKLVTSLSSKSEFPSSVATELVKKLRTQASSNFRGDASKVELAFAQRQAANEIDNLIERNLAQTGDAGLVNEYRAARQTIAKSHDIEAATNTATGNVSARKIAALANKGRPLTGGLDTIANTANAFPKAMQSESAFGEVEPLSVLDVGAGLAALPHNPSLLGAVLGRPLARAAVLSKPMQNRVLSAATNGGQKNLLQMPNLSGRLPQPYGPLLLSAPQLSPNQQ